MANMNEAPDWVHKTGVVWMDFPERKDRKDYEGWESAWLRIFGSPFIASDRQEVYESEGGVFRQELYPGGVKLVYGKEGTVEQIRVPSERWLSTVWPLPAAVRSLLENLLTDDPPFEVVVRDPGDGNTGWWNLQVSVDPFAGYGTFDIGWMPKLLDKVHGILLDDDENEDDEVVSPKVIVEGELDGWPVVLVIGIMRYEEADEDEDEDDEDEDDEHDHDPRVSSLQRWMRPSDN